MKEQDPQAGHPKIQIFNPESCTQEGRGDKQIQIWQK